MKFKLIVSDIDGTIKDGLKPISNTVLDALHKVQKKNIPVIISTGRHYAFIEKNLINSLNADYVVTINGSCIKDNQGKTVHKNYIPEEVVIKLTQLCKQYNISLGFKFDEKVVVYNKMEKFNEIYITDELTKNLVIENKGVDYHIENELPLGIFLIDPDNNINQIIKCFPNYSIAEAKRNCYDMFPLDFTKAEGIEYVMKLKGIKWADTIAFGDALNDFQMIKKAKVGVAMGNAKQGLKDVSDFITKSVSEDGVEFALEYFEII